MSVISTWYVASLFVSKMIIMSCMLSKLLILQSRQRKVGKKLTFVPYASHSLWWVSKVCQYRISGRLI